jgi:hypothetical protein
MNSLRPALVTLALLAHGALPTLTSAAQMRSRSEAIPDVQATNTVGLGDIWVTAGLSSYFRVRPVPADKLAQGVESDFRDDFFQLYGKDVKLQRELLLVPEIGGAVGLANFLHLEFQSVPWDGEKLGATTARLKFTTPGNDDLRVLGLGVSLNATLSTEEDIYSRGATTPGFDPLLYVSALADVDLIKVAPSLPLKLYLNYSNLDDYRFAHAYTQHQIVAAAEYKGFRKGVYVRLETLLYKPLATKLNPNPVDEYLPALYQLGLGYRMSVGDRYTVTADLSLDPFHPLSFYDREIVKPPKVHLEVTAPIIYGETRAEAIRALIFNEQQRRKFRQLSSRGGSGAKGDGQAQAEGGKSDSSGVAGLKLDDLSLEERKAVKDKDLFKGVFEDQEEETVEKRKQIRSQLKQIEELLE